MGFTLTHIEISLVSFFFFKHLACRTVPKLFHHVSDTLLLSNWPSPLPFGTSLSKRMSLMTPEMITLCVMTQLPSWFAARQIGKLPVWTHARTLTHTHCMKQVCNARRSVARVEFNVIKWDEWSWGASGAELSFTSLTDLFRDQGPELESFHYFVHCFTQMMIPNTLLCQICRIAVFNYRWFKSLWL